MGGNESELVRPAEKPLQEAVCGSRGGIEELEWFPQDSQGLNRNIKQKYVSSYDS